jgi:hypothetical protein
MRRDLLGDSSAADGIVKNREDVVVTDGLVRIVSGKEPLLGFVVSPVLPQDLEQNGRQHDHSILLSFALTSEARTMKTKNWTVIANTGKQADLESGLEKKAVQKPTHISASEFVHWLAATSRIDDNTLQSLFKR